MPTLGHVKDTGGGGGSGETERMDPETWEVDMDLLSSVVYIINKTLLHIDRSVLDRLLFILTRS